MSVYTFTKKYIKKMIVIIISFHFNEIQTKIYLFSFLTDFFNSTWEATNHKAQLHHYILKIFKEKPNSKLKIYLY